MPSRQCKLCTLPMCCCRRCRRCCCFEACAAACWGPQHTVGVLHVVNTDLVLTGMVETFSNSTTLPPLSPVAKYDPSASNSTAEMTSAAAYGMP